MVVSEETHVPADFWPGCLWLTSSTALAPAMRQRLLVQELDDAGASGLVVQLGGRGVAELPSPLLEEALVRRLPIVTIGRGVRPADLVDQLDGALIRVELELLREAEKVGRCFNRMVLQGATLDDVLSDISEDLDHPVILEDTAHQIVAFARRAVEADAADDWPSHSRGGHDSAGPGSVRRSAGLDGCLWTDLRIRGETWGRLHVLECGREFNDLQVLVADRGATAVGMLLLSQSSMDRVVIAEKNRLMMHFVDNRISAEDFAKRLESLSVATADAAISLIAFRLRGLRTSDQGLHPQQTRVAMSEVLEDLNASLIDASCAGFAGLAQDTAYGVVSAEDPAELEQLSAYVADLVLKRASAKDMNLVVGISGMATRQSLRRAAWESVQAAEYALTCGEADAVCRFRDLGVQTLLMGLGDGPELASFVEGEIGALLAYDATAKIPLLPTLEQYLTGGAKKLPTARQMHIDRRTLYQRLARIEEILGAGRLAREEDRARMWLAIQGLRILSRRSKPGFR
jgi:purine catabolism regulator